MMGLNRSQTMYQSALYFDEAASNDMTMSQLTYQARRHSPRSLLARDS